MVEQRFKLGTANAINEYGNFPILDNDKGLSLIEVINILNEYDAVFKSIDRLTDEEGGAIEYDTPNAAYYVFYHRVSGFKRCIPPNVILGTIKGLHKKIEEQQATIEQLQKKLSECQGYKLELTPIPISRTITLKEAEDSIRVTKYEELFDDEPFEFNKNCAKPYEIRSVSPNGVVRAGKKNSKVSWRMKDVREISQELPPFEDFDHETLQEIRNKFHTKFDNDVIGRIIYNIYLGTFEGLL